MDDDGALVEHAAAEDDEARRAFIFSRACGCVWCCWFGVCVRADVGRAGREEGGVRRCALRGT
jgi:hypothetical protein